MYNFTRPAFVAAHPALLHTTTSFCPSTTPHTRNPFASSTRRHPPSFSTSTSPSARTLPTMGAKWTAGDIPDLHGRAAIVTGSNSGLGLEIATQLAAKRARVCLACRTPAKGEAAAAAIRGSHAAADVEVRQLDTSSTASVRAFAAGFLNGYERLDVVMCNAGVMALEQRRESVDAHELQLATNHLGHFLLIGLLHPLLTATEGSRVVTQSSSANWRGRFDFDNLNANNSYERWTQYAMTKLANVAFTTEYNARLQQHRKTSPRAFAVHPGLVIGNLQTTSADGNPFYNTLYNAVKPLAGSYETGALPALHACTAPDANPDHFYGPDGWFSGFFGGNHPAVVQPNQIARDRKQTSQLWAASEEMTGFKFDV